MDIINRYIYAVIKQLAEDEKKEVEKELQILFYEMMEEYPETLEENEKARLVIEKLGNPDKLADKYRGHDKCLIGSRYYNKYMDVLKVVLLSMFIGITIANFFSVINSNENIVIIITEYIATLFQALLQAAAWVTIVFAVFEYKNINIAKETHWSIDDLPNIPNKNNIISKSESVFTIIFTTIFFSIFLFSPQSMGIYNSSQGELINIPIFNLEALSQYQLIIISIFLIEILQESLKIVWGVWNRRRSIIFSVTSIVSSALTIMFFSSISIWNSKVSEIIASHTGFEISIILNIIVIFIVIVTSIEVATSLYKGFKYDK